MSVSSFEFEVVNMIKSHQTSDDSEDSDDEKSTDSRSQESVQLPQHYDKQSSIEKFLDEQDETDCSLDDIKIVKTIGICRKVDCGPEKDIFFQTRARTI